MTHRVELVIDRDCPHVEAARLQLRQALVDLGEQPMWREWDRASADAPAYVKRYGSPTVLVNGQDVAGEGGVAASNCCRIYVNDGRLQSVPSIQAIQAALRGSAT